jgi:ATP-dependent DNA ligase
LGIRANARPTERQAPLAVAMPKPAAAICWKVAPLIHRDEGLTAEDMRRCRWLKPQLVAAIEFLEWTLDNHLRHPKFVSLRDDRDPTEDARERDDDQ